MRLKFTRLNGLLIVGLAVKARIGFGGFFVWFDCKRSCLLQGDLCADLYCGNLQILWRVWFIF